MIVILVVTAADSVVVVASLATVATVSAVVMPVFMLLGCCRGVYNFDCSNDINNDPFFRCCKRLLRQAVIGCVRGLGLISAMIFLLLALPVLLSFLPLIINNT